MCSQKRQGQEDRQGQQGGQGQALPLRTHRSRHRTHRIGTAVRLVAGLAILVMLGTLALSLPGMTMRHLAARDVLFTATSALAVTGLSTIVPSRDLTLLGQIVLMVLVQVGGVGFMAAAVIVLRLLGRKISLTDRLTLRDSFGLLEPRAILQVTARVVLTALAIELTGAILLWLNWRATLGDARAAFYGLFHAVSAFCNAGFDLFNGLPGHSGLPTDGRTLTIMGSLIVLGGLGIPVLGDLLTLRQRHDRLSLHSRITLILYAVLIVVGSTGFLLSESHDGSLLAGQPLGRQLELATFHAISARTAGFAGLANLEQLAPSSQMLTMGLMLIGSAPASMGGGVTTGTVAVLVLSLWAYVRGRPAAQVGGRTIATEAVRRASAILTTALLVVGGATWLILMTHPVTLDRALFEVISAFATCGLTLAFTGELNFFGQIVIMLVMFWGRLGALTIVAALAQPLPPQPVTYPEETLLIG